MAVIFALAAAAAMIFVTAAPAGASGRGYAFAQGGTVVQVDWMTVSKTSTVEALWVQVTGVSPAKVNSCGTGMSIWYNDANWTRRNLYQARDYCTGGPVWSFWTGTFNARRGSCVQATFRYDWVWHPGVTFCIS